MYNFFLRSFRGFAFYGRHFGSVNTIYLKFIQRLGCFEGKKITTYNTHPDTREKHKPVFAAAQ